MTSFSKKFVTSFFRDTVNTRSLSSIRLLDTPLQEVKVVEQNIDSYTSIRINPFTIEEQLIMYPVVPLSKGLPEPKGLEVVVVHKVPVDCPYIVIDVY